MAFGLYIEEENKELVDKNIECLVKKGFTKERALTVLLYKVSQGFVDLHEENLKLKGVK